MIIVRHSPMGVIFQDGVVKDLDSKIIFFFSEEHLRYVVPSPLQLFPGTDNHSLLMLREFPDISCTLTLHLDVLPVADFSYASFLIYGPKDRENRGFLDRLVSLLKIQHISDMNNSPETLDFSRQIIGYKTADIQKNGYLRDRISAILSYTPSSPPSTKPVCVEEHV